MKDSIIQDERRCFICDNPVVDRHHAFEGAYRNASEEWGAIIYLCRRCHMKAHDDEHLLSFLRKIAQRKVMEHYGWDEWDFIKHIGRSFL